MSDAVKTFTHNNHTIEIFPDYAAENPRDDYNLGVFAAFHRRHTLGDTNHDVQQEDVPTIIATETVNGAPCVALPVYMYEHSGITLATAPYGCKWDSGLVGVIYATIKDCQGAGHDWKNWTSARRADVTSWLKGEIATYSQYVEGDVYSVTVTSADGDQVFSCSGYYGLDHAIQAAMEETPAAPTPIELLQNRVNSIAA